MRIPTLLLAATLLVACGEPDPAWDELSRFEFAELYAEAWSSQKPRRLARFYAEDGVLVVNNGTPSRGRDAIEEKARGFMEAFPDMVVRLDKLVEEGDRVVFHWHWTGTNKGPGGSGFPVDIRGYEVWTFDSEGRLIESLGNYDEEEFERQIAPLKND